MESRLSIEKHIVSIAELSFCDCSNGYKLLDLLFFELIQVDEICVSLANLGLN